MYTPQLKPHRQQGFYKHLSFRKLLNKTWNSSGKYFASYINTLYRRTWTLPWSPQWGMGCSISWSCKDVLHSDSFRDTTSVWKHWILSFLWWVLDLSVRVRKMLWTIQRNGLHWKPQWEVQPNLLWRPQNGAEKKVNNFPQVFFQSEYLQCFFYFPSKCHNNVWKNGKDVSHCSTLQPSDFPKCFCWLDIYT